MRKLTAAAIVAGTAGALAWPPSRHWLADLLITTGCHLALDEPVRTPEDIERGRRRLRMAAQAKCERERNTNGHHPSQPI